MGDVVEGRFTGGDPELTKTQFMKYVGMSRRWVENRVSEGMPSIVLPNGHRRFRPRDTDPWLRRYEAEKGKAKKESTPAPTLSDSERLDDLERRLEQLEQLVRATEDEGEEDDPGPPLPDSA